MRGSGDPGRGDGELEIERGGGGISGLVGEGKLVMVGVGGVDRGRGDDTVVEEERTQRV